MLALVALEEEDQFHDAPHYEGHPSEVDQDHKRDTETTRPDGQTVVILTGTRLLAHRTSFTNLTSDLYF